MKTFLTLDDIAPKGKTVLLRADLNVPVHEGKITDMTRLTRLVPTIQELSSKGARIIVLSHFGRPRGRDASLTLKPVCLALAEAYGKSISFIDDCIGDVPKNAIAAMKDGDVAVVENVRFYPEEERNDAAFAQKIASLGDLYVNDAFSCAHRAHATTEGLARILPSYAGRLMEAEIDALSKVLEAPERPVVAIVGGAKISTKLDLLNNLVKKIDVLVLGGGMANTFLAAQGHPVGKSLCEREMKDQSLAIMDNARKHNCKIMLPIDGVVAREFRAGAEHETVSVGDIPSDGMLLDIGQKSIAAVSAELQKAKTVLWNGPVGAFETKPFDIATLESAKAVANLTQQQKLVSVAGGGDTVSALAAAGVEEKMTYVSTAGGAFLEWLEGKELPGVKALQKNKMQAA